MSLITRTSYSRICQALRGFLVDAVESKDHATVNTIAFQASATLYSLLLDHPINEKGRCRSCPRSTTGFGRRQRRCRVHLLAGFHMLYSGDFLLSHMASELGVDPIPQVAQAPSDVDSTEMLPSVSAKSEARAHPPPAATGDVRGLNCARLEATR